MYTEMYYFFWVWNLLNVVLLVKELERGESFTR